jgi:hypothetical protein
VLAKGVGVHDRIHSFNRSLFIHMDRIERRSFGRPIFSTVQTTNDAAVIPGCGEELRLDTGVSLVIRTDYYRPREQIMMERCGSRRNTGEQNHSQNRNLVA